MFKFRLAAAFCAFGLVAPQVHSHPHPVPVEIAKKRTQPVDVVLCLDVSNSMDGLIDSAKIKLWDVVNELAKMKPTPVLRVGLYSYGNPNYGYDSGYVRKELDLTTDLDEVYSKLNALKTNGGDEYVSRVTRDAVQDQKWSSEANALKIVFVCGNESADQDRAVHLKDIATLAAAKGIHINTIYCGNPDDSDAKGWREYAGLAKGSYASIDQNRAKGDLANTMKSPFDDEILKRNEALNKTYLGYGREGKGGEGKQARQDQAAREQAPAAAVGRALAKSGMMYNNAQWDLVDRLEADAKFDVEKLPESELPESLRKMKPAERTEHIKKMKEERAKLQKEIVELADKRAKFVAEEMKKQPKSEGEKALDSALKSIIREQAAKRGFEVPSEK